MANIADYTDFDSFMEMASARLNLVVSPIALKTAEMMEKEFGIPYLTAYITYDPEEITEVYRKLEKALDLDFGPASRGRKRKSLRGDPKGKRSHRGLSHCRGLSGGSASLQSGSHDEHETVSI